MERYRVIAIAARPLSVPLAEPFVIATGRMDATRAALVMATVVDEATGAQATGLGEAAALPPVTVEDQPELVAVLGALGARVAEPARVHLDAAGPGGSIARLLGDPAWGLAGRPVASAAVETALLDAVARLRGEPLWRLLRGDGGAPAATTLVSDVTIPIHPPAHMAELAARWRARGFRCFKVKVGRDPGDDAAALAAMAARVPDAVFRIDANGGYDARAALALHRHATDAGARVECFEQPCARDDLAGMARVARELPVPVVADESVRTREDLRHVAERRAAGGVNLKIAKSGVLESLALGRTARSLGLRLMVGAMVETRLGIAAAAHLCVALGGADYVDLDTAWLLAGDPFTGGFTDAGAALTLCDGPGLGVALRP